jgi:hypothetical protein
MRSTVLSFPLQLVFPGQIIPKVFVVFWKACFSLIFLPLAETWPWRRWRWQRHRWSEIEKNVVGKKEIGQKSRHHSMLCWASLKQMGFNIKTFFICCSKLYYFIIFVTYEWPNELAGCILLSSKGLQRDKHAGLFQVVKVTMKQMALNIKTFFIIMMLKFIFFSWEFVTNVRIHNI